MLKTMGPPDTSAADALEQRRQLMSELVMRLMLVRRAPVTALLMGIIGGMYGLSALMGGTTDPEVLGVLGAKVNPLIARGQWWRLVSSVFVHVGLVHVLVNGYALYVLGRLVENGLGRRRFLVLFVAAGVAGSVASFLVSPHPSAGASGAIFGLLGASVASGAKYRRNIPARLLRQMALALLPWLGIALAYGLMSDHIDNAAHLGGLATGLVFGALATSPLLARPPEPEAAAGISINLALGVSLGLLLYGALGSVASILHAAGV